MDAADYLTRRLEDAKIEDHVVGYYDRPAEEATAEVLRIAGWLPVA
jgi:hypothetical protein